MREIRFDNWWMVDQNWETSFYPKREYSYEDLILLFPGSRIERIEGWGARFHTSEVSSPWNLFSTEEEAEEFLDEEGEE